jgi:hypothetical protein
VVNRWYEIHEKKQGAGGTSVIETRKLRPGERPPEERFRFRDVYERGKERLETFSPRTGQPLQTVVFDGEVERQYDAAELRGEIRPFEPVLRQEGELYRNSFQTYRGRVRILTVLKERTNLKVHRGASPAGSPLLVLSSEPQPGRIINDASLGFRITLDPAHGLLPARIEHLWVLGGSLHPWIVTTIDEWKQADGVWVPVKMRTGWYANTDGQPPGTLLSETILTVDPAQSTWNKPIGPPAFTLGFPVGTRVRDRIRQVDFTVGSADTGRNIDALLENARQVVKIEEASIPPTWWQRHGGLALSLTALAALLSVGALLWVLRRRRLLGAG